MSAAKQLVDMRFLRTLVPLGELSDAQLEQLMGSYSVELLESGTELFRKGEHDSFTYYLLSGQIQLRFTDGMEKIVRSQTAQSRYILVPERPRSATATTLTTTTILKVNKEILDSIVGAKGSPGMEVRELTPGNQNDWMTRYLQSKVFLKLRAQNIQALMMRLEEIPVKAGQVIIRQNDDDGYYYIIKQGHCKVMRRNSPYEEEIEQAQLTIGTGFGEEAIISHNRRGATVTMVDDGLLMRLSRSDFHRILVEPLIEDVLYKEALKIENVIFLDVRHYDDYVKDGLTDSLNITLFELRGHIESLDTTKTYVAYSNHGHRAAAAAFLLCQQGLEGTILRAGLEGVPVDAPRGNKPLVDENNIPVVDNVISFDSSKQMVTTPRGLKSVVKGETKATEETPFRAEEALHDPRVQALLQHASNNVQQGVEQELLADVARQKAEHEVLRLRMEAKLAKRSAEQARRQAEKYAQESAEIADQKAREEAARLRELELGAKQAEMEEAVRQAEEEARNAREAENARTQAEKANILLKQQLDLAIAKAQDEADRSAETIRRFAAREEEKQRLTEHTRRELAEIKNREVEAARLKAQQEIEVLKKEIEITREQMQRQAEAEAKLAREEAKASAEKMAQQELDRVNSELIKTKEQGEKKISEALRIEAEKRQLLEQQTKLELQQEMQQIAAAAEAQATRANKAEQASMRAELEINKIKKDMEYARKQQHSASIVAAEEARQLAIQEANEESEKTLLQKEKEISEAISYAEECSLRARVAEAARDKAIQQTNNLQGEVANTQQQIQADLSQDIARSEIEHEVARARAVELANKQAEIEDILVQTEEIANRAKETERAKQEAESEVRKLKAEIERLHSEHENSIDENRSALSQDQLQRRNTRDEDLKRKQREIDQASQRAEQEVERARLAEIAHQQAQQEIQHLKTEVEIATLQATAQLESDKERSAAQQLEVEQKTHALAAKQTQLISAIERAQLEKRRAKEADLARREAEVALESYREDAEQHEKIQREISKVRAEAISKHVAMEAASKRARKEAARAEQAERARCEAEQEIIRLKKIAVVQHRKAEQAIRQSLEVVNEPANETMTSRKQNKAKKPSESDLQQSAWVSDHVMWETTLGLRDDKQVANLIAPDQNNDVKEEPWAEQLLTKISIPEPKNLDLDASSLDESNSIFNRTKFKTRELNNNITAQMDARDYIKRNHAVKKPVAMIIATIAVTMLVAMYFTMSGTQRDELKGNIKGMVSGKNNDSKLKAASKTRSKKETSSVQAVDSIEQRVEKNRQKAIQSQRKQQLREERESRRLERQRELLSKQKRKAAARRLAPTSTPESASQAKVEADPQPIVEKFPEPPASQSIPAESVIPSAAPAVEIVPQDAPAVEGRDILLDPPVDSKKSADDKSTRAPGGSRVVKIFSSKKGQKSLTAGSVARVSNHTVNKNLASSEEEIDNVF